LHRPHLFGFQLHGTRCTRFGSVMTRPPYAEAAWNTDGAVESLCVRRPRWPPGFCGANSSGAGGCKSGRIERRRNPRNKLRK
jgi:hypothetical protein